MKRRDFVKNSALASSAFYVPSFLRQFQKTKSFSSRSGKILVVIQLSGGNDGLNTVVPFNNDIYYKSRPQLNIPKNEVLKLTNDLGFNPNLQGLRTLYDEGLLSIVNNVGYPNPDRSHFRSMDIWHTASDSNEYLTSGWIGRYLDSYCQDEAPYHALELDDSLSLALKGQDKKGFAMSNPTQLKRMTNNKILKTISKLGQDHHDHEHEEVAYLYKTLIDAKSSANYLHEKSKVYKSTVGYPQTAFGKDLKQTAELITADNDTQIYYLSLTGFDTHANQKNQQNRLLKQYADGINAFVQDLQKNDLLKDTLIGMGVKSCQTQVINL
ncbi:MAG: DUF1501 domain-containing protein, partial [Bacteroidota bacterium]